MTHYEYAHQSKLPRECTAADITFAGRCMNCGYSKDTIYSSSPPIEQGNAEVSAKVHTVCSLCNQGFTDQYPNVETVYPAHAIGKCPPKLAVITYTLQHNECRTITQALRIAADEWARLARLQRHDIFRDPSGLVEQYELMQSNALRMAEYLELADRIEVTTNA